jgi:subtilisin family serine protease
MRLIDKIFFSYLLFVVLMIVTVTYVPYTRAEHLPLRIAIIDTGYAGTKLKLCPSGHFDYMTKKPVVGSQSSHGTSVGDIIADGLVGIDYCAVIFQIRDKNGYSTIDNYVDALERIAKGNFVALNISLAGGLQSVKERDALRAVAVKWTAVFVASGNDGKNLNYECDIFPACYDIPNVHPVGALDGEGKQAKTSNRGTRINLWYSGVFMGAYGTSFAAPRALVDYTRLYSRSPLASK